MPHPHQSISLLSILFKITLDSVNNVFFHIHEPQVFSNKNDWQARILEKELRHYLL